MSKREFHEKAAHKPTIADQLTGVVKYNTTANVIDDFNRVWSVTTKHSGFILNGLNHKGHIPYWSSYKLNLPNLRLFDGSDYPEPIAERQTLQQVIEAVGDANEARFVDDAGIVWEAGSSDYTEGYQIENIYDNDWLPWVTCGVIWLPGFKLLRTREQSKAIKKEFSTNG